MRANRKKWSRNFDGLLKPNGVHFTARETKVLRFVAEGLGDRQIAATLGIDIKAVKKHRQQATDKLNIHESADLIRYAV